MAGRKTDRSVEIQTNNICMDGKHYRQMRKCAVNWPSKHVARVEATFGEMKPVFLLICISFKPPLQLKSYGNPPVFCQRLFALQLPSFSQKFRRKRLSFPGSLNKSILLFWLSTKRERDEKKKKKAPPIFATHVLHHWIVVFMSFWIGCVFHCLGRSTREQTAPQNTNYSINFSELCVCVKTGKHTMGLQL